MWDSLSLPYSSLHPLDQKPLTLPFVPSQRAVARIVFLSPVAISRTINEAHTRRILIYGRHPCTTTLSHEALDSCSSALYQKPAHRTFLGRLSVTTLSFSGKDQKEEEEEDKKHLRYPGPFVL